MSDDQLLLSTLPPRRGQERLACLAALLLLIAFLVILPILHLHLGRLDVFIPVVATVTCLNDTITSALLFAQFSVLRTAALLVLATGYLLTGLLVIPYALTFPGAFSPSGWLGAAPQSTTWLFTSWHYGFLAIVLAYALLKDGAFPGPVAHGSIRTAVLASITVVLCLVIGLTWLATAGHDLLPSIMRSPTEFASLWVYIITPASALLCAAVIVVLWFRRRSLLDLWLLVVTWAWLLKSIIMIFSTKRYTVGWYANSVFAISAATFVLIILLSETTVMYARLALSVMAQRREREQGLMTMDAVTASIAHEINQPLAAIVNNGSAALRWLTREAPNVGKASEALGAIVADGHRASEIIAGIRAMFRRDKAEKQYTSVNDAVMEVLVLAQSELRTHSIAVEAALDSKLPPIKANRVQLQQVLLNLIGNAVEAMDAVTSRPRLLRVRTERRDRQILLTVEDTGQGIDPKHSDRIFDPLFTTKSNGMGLGLAICQSIVDTHGGRIWATPGVPCGTVFQFSLPTGAPGLNDD